MQAPVVIKIGGNEIDDPIFLAALSPALKRLAVPIIIVHGGGKEITHLQEKMGIEPRYLDGVRVTDAGSLSVVEMVLRGTVNTRLVRTLMEGGIEAQGLSGVDRGMIRAVKMPHPSTDMGFTGKVTDVRGEILLDMLIEGITPVIAPICLGETSTLNVNADHVAGAVAAAVGALRIVFLTNVEGVMIGGKVVDKLTRQQALDFIENGVIFGGMIPKVQTALAALESGVLQAVITNLNGLKSSGGTALVDTDHNWRLYGLMLQTITSYEKSEIDLGILWRKLADHINQLTVTDAWRTSLHTNWGVLDDIYSHMVDQEIKSLNAQHARLVDAVLVRMKEIIQST